MNKKPLSYSALKRYNLCSKNYQFHYIDKLREKTVTSYLSFGKAMDGALNALLGDLKANKSVESLAHYQAIYDNEWQTITINKVTHDLPQCTLVGYAKQDFCYEVLLPQDLEQIQGVINNVCQEYKHLSIPDLKQELDNLKANQDKFEFSDNHHKLLNFMNWLSLKRKGHLMIDAYIRDIIPLIDEVKETQKEVNLTSENGSFIGYLDAIVKFKGDTEYSVLDNKTSRRKYGWNDAKMSEQLSIYCFNEGINKAAFAVMLKEPKLNTVKQCTECAFTCESRAKTCTQEISGKRCGGNWKETVTPKIETQLLVDNVDKNRQNVILENMLDIQKAIDHNIFVRNLDACANVYGNRCPFYKKCFYQKDDNLIKLED